MPIIRRAVHCVFVLLLCNSVFLWNALDRSAPVKLLALAAVLLLYLWTNIRPFRPGLSLPKKLGRLGGGCELMLLAAACAALQVCICILCWRYAPQPFSRPVWIANTAVGLVALALLAANGAIRVMVASGQVPVTNRVVFLCLWWVPLVNIVLFARIYGPARREFHFGVLRLRRNSARKDHRVCATVYPILMVHGIFFRDWEHFNYWGHIPEELEENGAALFYGKQQSSSSVEQSAEELRDCILRIVE